MTRICSLASLFFLVFAPISISARNPAHSSTPPSVKASKPPAYHPSKSTARLVPRATTAKKRSPAVRAAFQRSNPCPATGKKSGACRGYVVDHIRPLACGGSDHPSNMAWQTTAAAKQKDKWERAGCR